MYNAEAQRQRDGLNDIYSPRGVKVSVLSYRPVKGWSKSGRYSSHGGGYAGCRLSLSLDYCNWFPSRKVELRLLCSVK